MEYCCNRSLQTQNHTLNMAVCDNTRTRDTLLYTAYRWHDVTQETSLSGNQQGSRLSRRVARSQNLTKERLGEDKELGIPKMRSQLSSSKHLGIYANACKCQHGSNMPTKSSTHSKGSTFPVDVATHEMI